MGDWYLIGLLVGLGVAFGILAAAVVPRWLAAAVVAAAAGVVVGFLADTPALRFLLEHGEYRRAASTFPSLTPVCLASIATGAHPDVHGIPHLVWWHRGEQRLVEYGSSFAAMRAAGFVQGLRDTIVNL